MSFITRLPIAHRGLHDGNQKTFENSMSAMRAAVEYGYAIELDVQVSGDGVAMVFHDATLDRLTNQTGLVKDRDTEELQSIKLGKTNDTIDTLEDVLLEIAGDVPVIIEMKGDGNAIDARALAKSVASDLKKFLAGCLLNKGGY
ncbi:MAG: glycerophosphodiester phosphodiesterase family protein, partial [Pseudomonadota bacterium]